MRTLVTADEALGIIRDSLSVLGMETVELSQCLGRVSAERVVAPEDLPGFDNSSMDGYALSSDRSGTPVSFRVIGESAAGHSFKGTLVQGQAVRIMTGAPIPVGATAVVEVERVQEQGGSISVDELPAPGRNIRRVGENVRRGETVFGVGTRLTPAHMGVLAALGVAKISLFRVPRVSVVTTGSELVPAGTEPGPGQIRNSSAVMVPAMVQESHAISDNVQTVSDEPENLKRGLKNSLSADLLITIGGVSVGKYDLVIKTLESLGVEFLFWKANIKPGMPIAFGRTDGRRPVFCLPGNPVSTAVTFLQFVRPALEILEGVHRAETPRLRAVLEHEVVKTDAKRHFSRGVVSWRDGQWTVRTTGSQSSGVLTSMVQANCLMILSETDRLLPKGAEVEVELL